MPFVPAVNCARVEFRMLLDNQRIENVCHFRRLGGAPTLVDLIALVGFCNTWWAASYSNVLSTSVILNEIVATALNADTGPQAALSGGGATGDIAAESLPNSVALCLTKRTQSIGRSARGRWYVAGIPDQTVVGNAMTQADANSFAARVHSLLFGAPPPGWEGVLVSYQHNSVLLATATIYPISGVIARDGIVDSQRRRLPGRGD